MEKINGRYKIVLKAVEYYLVFSTTKLVCFTIKNEAYIQHFRLNYKTFDDDILRQKLVNESLILEVLEILKEKVFIQNQNKYQEDVKHFIRSIKSSIFLLSANYHKLRNLLSKTPPSTKGTIQNKLSADKTHINHLSDFIIPFCLDETNTKFIRKHIYLFDNEKHIKDEEDIISHLLLDGKLKLHISLSEKPWQGELIRYKIKNLNYQEARLLFFDHKKIEYFFSIAGHITVFSFLFFICIFFNLSSANPSFYSPTITIFNLSKIKLCGSLIFFLVITWFLILKYREKHEPTANRIFRVFTLLCTILIFFIIWFFGGYEEKIILLTTLTFYSILYSFFYIIIPFSYKKENHERLYAFQLFSTKLSLFLIVGWISSFMLANDIWVLNAHFCNEPNIYNYLLVFLLTSIIILFFYYHLISIKPRINNRVAIKRIGHYFLLGFAPSTLIGILVIGSTYKTVYKSTNLFPNRSIYQKELSEQLSHLEQTKSPHYQERLDNYFTPICQYSCKDISQLYDSPNKFPHCIFTHEIDSIRFYINTDDTLSTVRISKKICNRNKNSINSHRTEILDTLCDIESNHPIPAIIKINFFGIEFFTFPMMLVLGNLSAFILGFFVQFVLPDRK